MQSKLPINLENLIRRRTVENERLEFKSTWNEPIKQGVVRSVCAFANDLLNNNGGYIILGIEEHKGKPILPPRGLDDINTDLVQREIIGACKGSISPEYLPHIFVEEYQGRTIMVVWAPAGDNRPYEAPPRKGKGRVYWIRSSGATVEASGDLRRQLLEQAAKIPFDDRRSLTGKMEDISKYLLDRFLKDSQSSLASMDLALEEIVEKMNLVVPVNDHNMPRNAALLFFCDDPDRFFTGTRIEVVQFADDAGGDLIEEKEFRGAIPDQVRFCLTYLDGIGGAMLEKVPGQAEVERTVPYPYGAVEEAVVNAVYHRSYEYPPEPIKVYLYPDRMEITSYPGPVPGIKLDHFKTGRLPAVPARNRRIGELLKDLRLAEARGTGIAKIHRRMAENGSPEAIFDFDEERTYFRVILPVHPHYYMVHTVREASGLWLTGKKKGAISLLKRTLESQAGSGILAKQLIEYAFDLEDLELARQVMARFEEQDNRSKPVQPYIAMIKGLLDHGFYSEVNEMLERVPPPREPGDAADIAALKKKIVFSFEKAAFIWMNRNQPEKALEFQLKALEIRQEVLADDLPNLATSYNNLSTYYSSLDEFEKALEFQLKAIEIAEKKGHANLGSFYQNLAGIYEKLDQLEEALTYAEKAVKIMETQFPGGHAILNVARNYLDYLRK